MTTTRYLYDPRTPAGAAAILRNPHTDTGREALWAVVLGPVPHEVYASFLDGAEYVEEER